jgi:hypothetical protein
MVHQDDYGDLPGFILLLYSKLEEGWNGKHYSWNGSTLQNIKKNRSRINHLTQQLIILVCLTAATGMRLPSTRNTRHEKKRRRARFIGCKLIGS